MGRRSDIFVAALAGTVLLVSLSFSGQQTDPFYLKILEKAEKSFFAQNYQDAVRDFEIAAFGLNDNKPLLAKVKVYMGLCRYYQNDLPGAEKYLREAADLMGEQGFTPLEIYEPVRPDLDRLTAYFNLAVSGTAAAPQDAENPPLADPGAKKTNPGEPAAKPDGEAGQPPAEKAETQIAAALPVGVNIEALKEGDLVPLDLVETLPELIKSVPAVYPAYARPLKIEGTVILNALISEKGRVIETEVVQGIPNALGFDQAAQKAVRQWRFEPSTVKGIKVKVWVRLAVEFKRSPGAPE